MKLELKHLAPYLPHEVRFIMEDGSTDDIKSLDSIINMVNFGHGNAKELKEIKLILRPLSGLTKVCTSEGEPEMTPLEIIFGSRYRSFNNGGQSFGAVPPWNRSPILWKYYETEQLFKMHFDVFELIEKGLAIDINTL